VIRLGRERDLPVLAVVADGLGDNHLAEPFQRHWTQRVFVIVRP
jgi:hypothetical protein